jgi:hypothetical protein
LRGRGTGGRAAVAGRAERERDHASGGVEQVVVGSEHDRGEGQQQIDGSDERAGA